ncbi:hypothetical protein CXK86_22560 [Paenibacillus sp. BGI2013]|uniref:hypothetical protein n=1 Tax=Paenibacillus TaxID=44249 RepID=UPI00096EAE29|nr:MULTISPECIES: hypothetical protein [Paenibacillus]OMF40843.1 hypothetical protein BK136_22700 [Paenibacillus amylolyticus]PJN48476.1 hypothetical protein PAEAM_60180 [Paenibacillus sp. GM1FR]PKQ88906.1 hypothetical protein CXK86_22560 [Paenibacillus sp. BGI2013]
MNDISSTTLFAQERRGQKKPEEAERAPLSPDFTLEEGKKKSGDNSDRKVILSSEWQVQTFFA